MTPLRSRAGCALYAGAGMLQSLRSSGLADGGSALNVFASPRRLAAHISHVHAVAADRAVSVKLMPVSVGLSADGSATPALLKKLASLGTDASAVPLLKQAQDGKAVALFFESMVAGATLATGLQTALDETLAKLPIPNTSWQTAGPASTSSARRMAWWRCMALPRCRCGHSACKPAAKPEGIALKHR